MTSTVIPAASATLNLASIQFVPLQLFSGEFLYLAVVFIVLALIAGVLGARGVAGMSMAAAKWFIILFVVLAIISLVL